MNPTNPTFEQELYDVVRKWNPSPDFGAFTVILETERLGRVFVRNVSEDEQSAKSDESKTTGMVNRILDEYEAHQRSLQPTMQLRWHTESLACSSPPELQQLYRSADGREEWRAVPTEL